MKFRLGSLAVDRQADISVLQLHDGDWEVFDIVGDSLRVNQAFVPVLAVKRGQMFEPDWGPRHWGWEPDQRRPEPERHGTCHPGGSAVWYDQRTNLHCQTDTLKARLGPHHGTV